MQDYTSSIFSHYASIIPNFTYYLEYCEDGSVMTLYFDKTQDKWKTSTTNKKDASKSFYFSKKSFDELFWEAFPKEAMTSLDTSQEYKFILLHPENRLVVKHQRPELVFIAGAAGGGVGTEAVDEGGEAACGFANYFRGPYKIFPVLSSPPSLQFLESFYNPYHRGILLKIVDNTTNEVSVYKYDFYYYQFMASVRGNNKNISVRYLQLLKNRELLNILVKEYPEWTSTFISLENSLEELYDYLYKMYVTVFIEHVKIDNLDSCILNVLKSIHYHSKKTTFCMNTVKYAIANLKNCSYQINKLFIVTGTNSNALRV